MKTLPVFLIVLLLIFTTNSALALTGSVNTELYPTKSGAINAVEKLAEDVQEGRNLLTYEEFYNYCQNQSSDVTAIVDFTIKSVWVNDESGFEKKYYGLVGYDLQCFSHPSP